MIDLASTAIDPAAPENQAFLSHLQGGILKSHGRDHVRLLLLRFTAAPRECRAWLSSFAEALVTSARRQFAEAERFRLGERGDVFGNLFLTAPGYQALGRSAEEIARFQEGLEPVAWKNGMAAASQELNDPRPADWETPYQCRRIHAMVLLADDDPDRLLEVRDSVVQDLRTSGVAEVLTEESGITLRNADVEPVEPFGYLDGRSQPLFLRGDVDEERTHNGGTFRVWDPQAPLRLAVLPDPLTRETDACGSYLVFRKLEQNVRGFRQQLASLASRVAHGSAELAGAMAVGRFEDGTPVLASQAPTGMAGNDFDFSAAHSDRKCPFHAHIRKANPRGESGEGLSSEKEHRIVRRSIPYGGPPDPNALPDRGVGLLFMCFQSTIAQQFAFIQKRWANESNAPVALVGIDPLVGQPSGAAPITPQRWQNRWDDPMFLPFDFRGFVRLLGGEFFFAPSIPFLLGR